MIGNKYVMQGPVMLLTKAKNTYSVQKADTCFGFIFAMWLEGLKRC